MSKSKRKSKSNWSHDVHDILGKARIFRTDASGDVFQFQMWISEEKKHLRKTLKTRDLKTAIDRAEQLALETLSDVKTGKKIFGITLQELVEEYLKWRAEDVAVGNITAGRLITIKSQLKHFLKFKIVNFKVSELDRASYYDYSNWRKKRAPTVRDVTIRNEQSTINHMMGYGFRKGLSHIDRFDFRKLHGTHKQNIQRDTFTLKEYDSFVRFMRLYVSKKSCPDDNLRMERLMIRDCILIASNTMLRVGELWNLKWGDIKSFENSQDSTGYDVILVKINVRAETAKTRKSRTVITRGGEYFKRLKKRSKYVENENFIFSEINGTKKFARNKFYFYWKELTQGIGIDHKKRNLTWYSLRHFGITCRLRAGCQHSEISKLAGTSIAFIENHYGHYDDAMLRATALKNYKISKESTR